MHALHQVLLLRVWGDLLLATQSDVVVRLCDALASCVTARAGLGRVGKSMLACTLHELAGYGEDSNVHAHGCGLAPMQVSGRESQGCGGMYVYIQYVPSHIAINIVTAGMG
ncbi:hypothetical protein V8C86DRAFT_2907514 [Haematococcus lacustris]